MGGRARGWSSYSPLSGATYPQEVASPDVSRRPELADVGRLARRGLRMVLRAARADEGETLASKLRGHLGDGPGAELSVLEQTWPAYEHVNVQAGLDAWLTEGGRSHELVGVIGFQHRDFGLGELLAGTPMGPMMGLQPGNVARVNLPAGPDGEVRACVRCALYLVQEGGHRTALLLRGAEPQSGHDRVTIQAVGTEPALAALAVTRIRESALEHNVFRG